MSNKPTYEELEQRIHELEQSERHRDETERKLRESEEQYRTLVEKSIQGVIIAQDDPMRLSFVSQPMGIIFGYSPEEMKALTPEQLVELIHPEDQEMVFGSFRKRLAGESAPTRYECRLIHKTLGTRWVAVYSSFILYNNEPATQTIFVDITPRKQAEEKLRENAAFLRSLINTIPIPVFYKDRQGIYLGFNRAFEKFFGQTEDALVGKSAYDISPKELADVYQAKDEELFRQGGVQEYAAQVKNARGQVREVSFRKTLHYGEQGEVKGLIGTVLDVTERNKSVRERENLIADLQEALSRVKTLSGLLPICAHCKKIRDDKGYWNRIESYIQERSAAEFSHGICPECVETHYSDFVKK